MYYYEHQLLAEMKQREVEQTAREAWKIVKPLQKIKMNDNQLEEKKNPCVSQTCLA